MLPQIPGMSIIEANIGNAISPAPLTASS